MNIWSIISPLEEINIEVSNITLLYKQHYKWHQLIRSVNSYFNIRGSNIEIFEDGVPINKRDWKCFFIPFDANLHLSKITASSPLKEIQNDITEQLTYSPMYQELLEIWENLNDDLDLLNNKLEKWGIKAKLKTINENELSQFITFNPLTNNELSPIEAKTLLLNIILNNVLDKKTLVIIELPELFASDDELNKFTHLIKQAVNIGYKFLIISEKRNFGAENHFYQNKIVNSAKLEQIKQKVCNEVPFYCSDQLYERAKNYFFQLVDNSVSEDELFKFNDVDLSSIITIIHVIMYNLNMGPIQVPQGIEPNLKKFITTLHEVT